MAIFGTNDRISPETNQKYYFRVTSIYPGKEGVSQTPNPQVTAASCKSPAFLSAVNQLDCINDKIPAVFNWSKATPGSIQVQWIDVDKVDANDPFTGAYFATTAPPSSQDSSYQTGNASTDPAFKNWQVPHLEQNSEYYWRINTQFTNDSNWYTSNFTKFTTKSCSEEPDEDPKVDGPNLEIIN